MISQQRDIKILNCPLRHLSKKHPALRSFRGKKSLFLFEKNSYSCNFFRKLKFNFLSLFLPCLSFRLYQINVKTAEPIGPPKFGVYDIT